MNEDIMIWSSKKFYHEMLYAAPSVKDHQLKDLQGVTNNPLTSTVLKLVDTTGVNMKEVSNNYKKAPSFANIGEAALVINHVKMLIKSGISDDQIAIITPYNFQVSKNTLKFCIQKTQSKIKNNCYLIIHFRLKFSMPICLISTQS